MSLRSAQSSILPISDPLQPTLPRHLASAVVCGFAGAFFAITLLKETPLFWRDAGGYPLELRAWVKATYYPQLAVTFAILAEWTSLLLRDTFRDGKSAGWLLTIAAWCLFFGGLALLVANNVTNLLHGLPLHAHPQ